MKKIVSAIMAVVMFFTTGLHMVSASEYEVRYSYYARILFEKGLFIGSDMCFDLDKPMTRAEAAVLITRMLGMESYAKAAALTHPFSDVPAWAAVYVGYMFQNNLTNGIGDGLYGSDDPLMPEQFVTMLLRVLQYKDNVDFFWEQSLYKAADISLMSALTFEELEKTRKLYRDHVVMLAYSALNMKVNNSQSKLIETITVPGKPDSALPYSTQRERAEAAAKIQNSGSYNVIWMGDNAAVPSYETINSGFRPAVSFKDSDITYYEYTADRLQTENYANLLVYCGFEKAGSVKIKPTSICLGGTEQNAEGYVSEWYRKGSLNIVFGYFRGIFTVRVCNASADTDSRLNQIVFEKINR